MNGLIALDIDALQARRQNAHRCTVEDVMPEGWAVLYAQDVAALLQALDGLCVTHQQCSRGYRAALEHINLATMQATDPELLHLRHIARTALGLE